jgi:hypothetical protein
VTKSPTRPTGPSGTPRKGGDQSKGSDQNKAAETKAVQGKPSESKPSENKPSESKASASKSDQGKTDQGKAPQSKAAQADSAQAKPGPAAKPAAAQAAPGPQPSPAVTRNPERVARAKAGTTGAPPSGGGAGASGLVTAGLIGGLLAGAAFIAYDLLLRPTPDAETRLAAIEARVGELAGDTAPPALPDDLAARLDALEAQADEALSTAREAAERPIPDMPDVPRDTIDANTAAIDSLQGDLAALQDDIAALQGTVSGLQAEVPMEGRIAAATRASAADYILGALVDGRPYEQALDVLRGQDVSEDALAALEPFATEGAPRPYILAGRLAAALAGEEPPPEPAVTEREPGEGAGFLQLFVDRAITVERVDAPRRDVDTGSAQPVIMALESGDTQAALAAWQALPGYVQAQASDVGDTLDQLVAARAAALDIAQTALTALANGR